MTLPPAQLDAASEWFFDEATSTLTLFWNATAGTPPPSDAGALSVPQVSPSERLLSAEGDRPRSPPLPQLRELFNITGSQAAPVVGVSFRGLGFRDAAISYLQPHGLPSSGDWALARTGALFFEVRPGACALRAAGARPRLAHAGHRIVRRCRLRL